MLPAQRRQVLQEVFIRLRGLARQHSCGAVEIGCIPQCDRCGDSIQTTGTVELLFGSAVAHFAQTIEEHRVRQCVARFAFVESNLHAPTQFHTFSGSRVERPGLAKAMEHLREGDTLVVWKLD